MNESTHAAYACDTGEMTEVYLSLQDVADRIGRTRDATSKLQLPAPDVVVGSDLNARRGWSVDTIDEWSGSLQGRQTLRSKLLLHLPGTVAGLAETLGASYNAVWQTLRRMEARGEVAHDGASWELAGSGGV